MYSIESLRNEIADEIDAFSATVDDLESSVSEAEAAVTSNKFYDSADTAVVKRDASSAEQPAAD